jgi:DNA-binding SARP family transcriptional activator
MMFFKVLGPVELSGQDGTTVEISAEKQRRLLAALLLRANAWVSSDYLVEAVWPDKPPKSTGGNVATYVHYLRGVLPPTCDGPRIDSRRGAYQLRVERHECDATVFEDRVSAATEALAHAQPPVAVDQLRSALGLWRGEPYDPLTGIEVEAEAERLNALRWHTRYTLAETLLAAGQASDAITMLRPLTAEDPLREKTWELLLRALVDDERWAEVLVAFQKVRQMLADELGIAPGPELRRLHQLALRADEREPHHNQVTPANQADAAPAEDHPQAVRTVATHRRVRPWRRLALLVVSLTMTWVVYKNQMSASEPPATTDTSTPVLTFLSPPPGQVVKGVVTIRVTMSNPSRLRQVDFHYLKSRCPEGGKKDYIGPDKSPTADGTYEISFDTRLVTNGCLEVEAVGLDRTNRKILYPTEGAYTRVTVNNESTETS